MSLIFHASSNKLGIFFYDSYIQAKLGNLGRVILMALCVGIIVHHKEYLHETLFIPLLFLVLTISVNTIIENTDNTNQYNLFFLLASVSSNFLCFFP